MTITLEESTTIIIQLDEEATWNLIEELNAHLGIFN